MEKELGDGTDDCRPSRLQLLQVSVHYLEQPPMPETGLSLSLQHHVVLLLALVAITHARWREALQLLGGVVATPTGLYNHCLLQVHVCRTSCVCRDQCLMASLCIYTSAVWVWFWAGPVGGWRLGRGGYQVGGARPGSGWRRLGHSSPDTRTGKRVVDGGGGSYHDNMQCCVQWS